MTEDRFRGPFVITGLSGSGKSVLSRSLEDLGYLCVDNIPLELVPELFATAENDLQRLVVVLDVRARGLREKFPEVFRELSRTCPALRVVFVEASPDVLLRRFSLTRRPHPLRDRSLEQAIADEEAAMAGLRALADLVVDTTSLSPHDLKRQILSLAGTAVHTEQLAVEVQSFSYLQGVPATASLVFDVRFLPNPYFENDLRELPGDDPRVAEWLDAHAEVDDAVGRLVDLVVYLLPRYGHELKSDLMIAVGCTGGRHRSVYVAQRLGEAVGAAGYDVVVHHRDKERWR
jgi:RNase adapter protein RapZ